MPTPQNLGYVLQYNLSFLMQSHRILNLKKKKKNETNFAHESKN